MSSLGKVYECSEKFPQTDIWMDGFEVADHEYALAHGSVGVTTSPTWVADMVDHELAQQTPYIQSLIRRHPEMNEQEILWQFTLDMAKERSGIMLPLFDREGPHKGRFSVQVNVYDYQNADKMVRMAEQVHAQNRNMQVKIPATSAGIKAIEEATYRGVSVMATACVSVSQAIAIGEAIERAFARREAEGLSNDQLNPVCACLLGVQEQWLSDYAVSRDLAIDPAAFTWAGAALVKKTYAIYKERGFHTRLLVAWYRHMRHWSEYIGGDIIMTIPAEWQKRFETCDIEIKDYMSRPVPEEMMFWLRKLPPFMQAYEADALKAEDFDSFAPVICILRFFIAYYEQAVHQVRDIMLPDPVLA